MGASGGGPAGERVLARSQGDPQPAVRLPCSSRIGVPSLCSLEHASRADSGFVFLFKAADGNTSRSAALPHPASGEARVNLLSPRALAHIWISFHPKLFGRNVNIFRFLEGACHRVPFGSHLVARWGARPRDGVPPAVWTPLGRWFRRTGPGPRIRGDRPWGGLPWECVPSQMSRRGPGRHSLIVRASLGLASPCPVPGSPLSARVLRFLVIGMQSVALRFKDKENRGQKKRGDVCKVAQPEASRRSAP